jgi:hypothetical protein
MERECPLVVQQPLIEDNLSQEEIANRGQEWYTSCFNGSYGVDIAAYLAEYKADLAETAGLLERYKATLVAFRDQI